MTIEIEVPWEYKGYDYIVTCKMTSGVRESYWAPEELPEMEIVDIQVDDGDSGGPITEEMYTAADEDDNLYERACEQAEV